MAVSIHAPARGATEKIQEDKAREAFQSTLPHGERQSLQAAIALTKVSIHAPARGATLDATVLAATAASFNPRSRTGSDSTY